MKIVLYSIISFAFLACGGTTSSGESKKDDSLLSSNISGNILVVEGMKKDVKVTASRDNVTYTILNKKDISQDIEIDKNSGLMSFWSHDAVDFKVTVTVEASDASGWKSKPLNLIFQTVSKNRAITKKIIKTGAADGGSGVDRNFVVYGKYVQDPFGNVWENKLDKKSSTPSLYPLAENRCLVLKSINKGSHWRLPTADELLTIVDYNKTANASMIDSAFEESSLDLWIASKDGNYQVFSQTTGRVSSSKLTNRHAVRCINAPKRENDYHVVSTGAGIGDDTYDFSTGLMWSAMNTNSKRKIVDNIEENASEYCANYDNSSGWRLPSINEVQSIIEVNTISSNILKSSTIIASSTPYVSKNTNTNANYIVGIDNNKILYGVSPSSEVYYITCVKKIP